MKVVFTEKNLKLVHLKKILINYLLSDGNIRTKNIDIMQLLVTLLTNDLYGEQIRKDIEGKFARKSEYWMMSEYDERVKDFWRLSHSNYVVKIIDDAGLEGEVKKLNTMLLHLGSFVLSNIKRIMNKFIHSYKGF